MNNPRESNGGDGISKLLTETLDHFARLVSEHVGLARLEFTQDIRTQWHRVATLAATIPFAFCGYVLVCMGLTLILSRWTGASGALLLVGGLHLLGALAAWRFFSRNLRANGWMHESTSQASDSLAAVAAGLDNGSAPGAATLAKVTASELRTVDSNALGGSHQGVSQR